MRTEAFNPKFHQLTPQGKLNFIGAVNRYFNIINENVASETADIYIRDYNERIFPIISPGKAIDEYDEIYIDELLSILKKQHNYNEVTIESRYRHLLTDPCDAYYKDTSLSKTRGNPFWGAGYKLGENTSPDGIESVLLRIPKSLDLSLELKAAKMLLDPTTDDGAKIGLAIMLCCGVRNNEAAGFNFGDFSEILDHSGHYLLRLTRTSKRDSNERKAGGKTRNAPRRLPLIRRFSDFIIARKEYLLSKIQFPFTDKKGVVFTSIDDLPIACRDTDYTVPCNASDLTSAGRAFLRDDLKMREQTVCGLSYIIKTPEYEVTDKDPTTYLLRRNFATHLYTLGFPTEWSRYYMGHRIEDDDLKRSDFNDEGFLYQMSKLLERHPLNEIEYSPERITVSASDFNHQYVLIENSELNDPMSVSIHCRECSASILIAESIHPLPKEIDITRYLLQRERPRRKNIFD